MYKNTSLYHSLATKYQTSRQSESVSWKSILTFGTRYTNFRRQSLGHVSYTLSITVFINDVLFHYAPHSDDLDYIQRRLVFIVRVVSPILIRGKGEEEGEEGHTERGGGDIKSHERGRARRRAVTERRGRRRSGGVLDRKVCLTVKR